MFEVPVEDTDVGKRLQEEINDLKVQNMRLYQIISCGFVDKKKYNRIKDENSRLNMEVQLLR